jgi:hypothetical protein
MSNVNPTETEVKPFIKVRAVKTDLIESVLKNISIKPGLSADITEKELSLFQFRLKGKDQYEVCIPVNLESFVDNWVVRLAIVAAQNLKAEFVASSEEVKELKFVNEYKEYIHGLCAAFKQSCMEGGIVPDGTSGKFHQGFCWAVSQTLKLRSDADLFKLDFTSPWVALTGNAVWNAKAPVWQRNLYQLVVLSAKNLNILKPESFSKSPEQVINEKFVKTWAFENRACFSDYEVTYMISQVKESYETYKEWVSQLKPHWEKEVFQVKDTYLRLTKDLRKYNARIEAIASIRATSIFRSTKRGKKDTVPVGLTREARLEYLSFAAWIQATNPTGLSPVDDRIETKLSQTDDELAAQEFLDGYLKIFKDSQSDPKLLVPWIRTAEMKANAIIKAISHS